MISMAMVVTAMAAYGMSKEDAGFFILAAAILFMRLGW